MESICELNTIFGYEAPSRVSVYRLYGEFNRGSSIQDKFREGRPKSVVIPKTNGTVHEMIAWLSCDLS